MISEDDDEKNIIERPETSMDSSDRCDDMMPEEESVAEEDSHTDEEEEAAEPSEPLDLSMKWQCLKRLLFDWSHRWSQLCYTCLTYHCDN